MEFAVEPADQVCFVPLVVHQEKRLLANDDFLHTPHANRPLPRHVHKHMITDVQFVTKVRCRELRIAFVQVPGEFLQFNRVESQDLLSVSDSQLWHPDRRGVLVQPLRGSADFPFLLPVVFDGSLIRQRRQRIPQGLGVVAGQRLMNSDGSRFRFVLHLGLNRGGKVG